MAVAEIDWTHLMDYRKGHVISHLSIIITLSILLIEKCCYIPENDTDSHIECL